MQIVPEYQLPPDIPLINLSLVLQRSPAEPILEDTDGI